ncbi:IS3 family transposase [Alicyclobacillus contaminans]|uniref:IS3 family transposase n=1 Tax=Alicyclobacillus contaminans TaxID=392016 RepID=UPI00146F9DBA
MSRQGYYSWCKRRKSSRIIDREILEQSILEIYQEYKGRYGSPRIALELYKRGMFTSKNRALRQMQRMGLVAMPWRRKQRLGRRVPAHMVENLVQRAFHAQTKIRFG